MERSYVSVLLSQDWSVVISLVLAIYTIEYLPGWIEKARWLLNGPGLLASKYSTGKPFTIQTPETQFTLVSAEKHIRELSSAKEDHLSLVASAEEVFQPAHTMNGVELNRLGMQHKILRTMSLGLPAHQEQLAALVQEAILQELGAQAGSKAAWQSMSIFSLTQRTIAKANTHTFYGSQFATDETFLKAARQYPQDVFMAAEALRCVSGFLAPITSWLVTQGHKSSKILMAKLLPVFEQRVRGERPQTMDYIQHIVDVFPERGPGMASKMVNQTLALWFASVHQPAIALCNAIVDLCTHQEYQAHLREEFEANIAAHGYLNMSKLPLMESFLKESARMNASESISLRRKAQEDFTFQDGLNVAKGEWLCVPQREIMRDSAIYPNADQFKGFRFVDDHENNPHSTKAAKFADIHTFFPIWGLGKHACPGRFYASFIIKLTLVELLQNYELRLPSTSNQQTFRWRSSILPMPTARFEARQRG